MGLYDTFSSIFWKTEHLIPLLVIVDGKRRLLAGNEKKKLLENCEPQFYMVLLPWIPVQVGVLNKDARALLKCNHNTSTTLVRPSITVIKWSVQTDFIFTLLIEKLQREKERKKKTNTKTRTRDSLTIVITLYHFATGQKFFSFSLPSFK